jgi:hypothetical protein
MIFKKGIIMNLQEFCQKYEGIGSHARISIKCDGDCGNTFTPLKTRAQQTIGKRGQYLCRSCGQKAKHAREPVSETTKEKIGQGVHEARYKKLIEDVEDHIKMDNVLDWELVLLGDEDEGVLWTIEVQRDGAKLIIANLFNWHPSFKSWMFKDVCEMEGPVAVCCPLRLLNNSDPFSLWWRERVFRFNESTGLDNYMSLPPMPQIVREWIEDRKSMDQG